MLNNNNKKTIAVTLTTEDDLHMRPSYLFFSMCKTFESEITFTNADDPIGSEFDAKHIMQVVMGAAGCRNFLIQAEGHDADSAIESIDNFFKTLNFGNIDMLYDLYFDR